MENRDEIIKEAVTYTLISCASNSYCDSLNQVTRRRKQWRKTVFLEKVNYDFSVVYCFSPLSVLKKHH